MSNLLKRWLATCSSVGTFFLPLNRSSPDFPDLPKPAWTIESGPPPQRCRKRTSTSVSLKAKRQRKGRNSGGDLIQRYTENQGQDVYMSSVTREIHDNMPKTNETNATNAHTNVALPDGITDYTGTCPDLTFGGPQSVAKRLEIGDRLDMWEALDPFHMWEGLDIEDSLHMWEGLEVDPNMWESFEPGRPDILGIDGDIQAETGV